jgi:predicted RNA-binding protein with RPS1 domain
MSDEPDGTNDAVNKAANEASHPAALRRIQIGTQRAGVKPPTAGPTYQYVSSLASQTSRESLAATTADTPPPSPPPANERTADSSAPAVPPTAPAAAGERRGRRRDDRPKPPRASDVLPPAKRVAVPSLRGSLDEDLEADFAAALGGLEVDALLSAEAAGQLEKPLDPGTKLVGTVLSIGGDTAFVDLGGRRQGALKLASVLAAGGGIPDDGESLQIGQTVEVTVGGRNDDDNLYDVALANHAVAVEDWSQLQEGMIVAARVTAANKGGLECDVAGLRGFMPASLVSTWRIENLGELVGQTLESLVTEIAPEARRLVLSRRAVIEKQAADARVKLLETLEPGAAFDGTVRTVRDFGAFVDIGNGVEGLVHVSELSWERVANPADVLQPGQKVRVVVKKIDTQTGKIGLSARDLIESPWKRAAETYHIGATVRGTVSRIAQFGAFVRLEPGVEGLVHVSELATRHIRSVGDVVKEGQTVECRVLAVDPDEQRMSLSIKALAAQAAADNLAADESADVEEPAAAPPKKRTTPLKGGVGGESDGARFGLRW